MFPNVFGARSFHPPKQMWKRSRERPRGVCCCFGFHPSFIRFITVLDPGAHPNGSGARLCSGLAVSDLIWSIWTYLPIFWLFCPGTSQIVDFLYFSYFPGYPEIPQCYGTHQCKACCLLYACLRSTILAWRFSGHLSIMAALKLGLRLTEIISVHFSAQNT